MILIAKYSLLFCKKKIRERIHKEPIIQRLPEQKIVAVDPGTCLVITEPVKIMGTNIFIILNLGVRGFISVLTSNLNVEEKLKYNNRKLVNQNGRYSITNKECQ